MTEDRDPVESTDTSEDEDIEPIAPDTDPIEGEPA